MGGLGAPEILVILVIALIIFGPRKLPDLGKKLGEGLAQFRKASDEFKRTWETEVRMEQRYVQPLRPAVAETTRPFEPVDTAIPGVPETAPIPPGADEEHAAAMMLGTVPSTNPTLTRAASAEPIAKEAPRDWM